MARGKGEPKNKYDLIKTSIFLNPAGGGFSF